MPLAGGFGIVVGIQDAHNLAWKLAAVLQGWAAPELLATYEAERAPISREITEQLARNALATRSGGRSDTGTPPAQAEGRPALGRPEFFREHGLVFGANYATGTLVPDGTPPISFPNPVTDYVPAALPGSHPPYVWLEHSDGRISTLDLFGRSFVLLIGSEGRDWCEAAAGAAKGPRHGLKL